MNDDSVFRSREVICRAADWIVAEEPGLIPQEDETYEAWLEATGRDDSFVGDGISIPGTADLYDAAMRALDMRQTCSKDPGMEESRPEAPGP